MNILHVEMWTPEYDNTFGDEIGGRFESIDAESVNAEKCPEPDLAPELYSGLYRLRLTNEFGDTLDVTDAVEHAGCFDDE